MPDEEALTPQPEGSTTPATTQPADHPTQYVSAPPRVVRSTPSAAATGPIQAWKLVMSRYATFGGRALRQEYWWFTLAQAIIYAVVFLLAIAFAKSASALSVILLIVGYIYVFASLLPSLGVAVRRLHDTGKSGWMILVGIIPFVGGIILLVLLVQDSTQGPNEFGESEKYPLAVG